MDESGQIRVGMVGHLMPAYDTPIELIIFRISQGTDADVDADGDKVLKGFPVPKKPYAFSEKTWGRLQLGGADISYLGSHGSPIIQARRALLHTRKTTATELMEGYSYAFLAVASVGTLWSVLGFAQNQPGRSREVVIDLSGSISTFPVPNP